MFDRSPRWPHHQYTEPVRPEVPSRDFWLRLAQLSEQAARLQGMVEDLLREPEVPTVLLVEDDPATRRALKGILTHRGWMVVEAGTLADGLAGLDHQPPPSCVILDLMLPDGDGSMILQAARSSGLEIRFVVTTGVEDPVRLRVLARLEPDVLLQKPVEVDELCQACLGPT